MFSFSRFTLFVFMCIKSCGHLWFSSFWTSLLSELLSFLSRQLNFSSQIKLYQNRSTISPVSPAAKTLKRLKGDDHVFSIFMSWIQMLALSLCVFSFHFSFHRTKTNKNIKSAFEISSFMHSVVEIFILALLFYRQMERVDEGLRHHFSFRYS